MYIPAPCRVIHLTGFACEIRVQTMNEVATQTQKYNRGVQKGDTYIKYISINKAVLWRDRCISLNPDIVTKIVEKQLKWIMFKDEGKREKWRISVKRFMRYAHRKKVGQEEQYYIPIDYFDKKKYDGEIIEVGKE